MAGRIPQQFIDELLNRVDIVDLIDSRVPLRKAGRDYQARCPFHEEKSPSFTVSQNKQFYHCFGCQANGNAIGFLMEYEHMEFVDAINELANRAGLEVPVDESAPAHKPSDDNLYTLMQAAQTFYRTQLRDHPESNTAIDYLKNRGLTGDIAAEFGIGFAPPGWDKLQKALGTNPKSLEQLITTGMSIRKDGDRQYDRFRNRIMFPIRDRRGRVIGFGGRVLSSEDNPKYLNSPESPLFHKGKELYGLFEARQALRQIDHLLVVEGYMDVVALAQHGVRYAVATLGTALTSDHLSPLFRTAKEAVFCFDGDRAGRDAAWKALDIVLPQISDGRSARFMFLPDGEDPDTLIRKIGKEDFETQIKNAVPLSSFLLENLIKGVDMKSIDGRAQLVDLARPKLTKISNTIYRHMIINELAGRVGMGSGELMSLLGEKPIARNNQRHSTTQRNEPRKLSPVRSVITLLLNQPQLAQLTENPGRYLSLEEPGIGLMVELLELLQHSPHLNCGAILEHWRERPEGKHLAKLAQTTLTAPETGVDAEFQGALMLLDKQRIERAYSKLLNKAESGTGLSDIEKQQLTQLQSEKRNLSQQLGNLHKQGITP